MTYFFYFLLQIVSLHTVEIHLLQPFTIYIVYYFSQNTWYFYDMSYVIYAMEV